MKSGLLARDAKLTSYHVKGTTREAGQTAAFEFFFRAPDKTRGVITAPLARTLSYDGQKLYEIRPREKKLLVYTNELPPLKGAAFLTGLFSPFVSEGYRVPLLTQNARAERVADTVQLTESATGPEGTVTEALTLRWPALDFLEKRIESGGFSSTTRVTEEQCDAKLQLCVPKTLVQSENGKDLSTTTYSLIELNVRVPSDDFTLTAPPGFTTEPHRLVPSEPDGG